MEYSDQNGSNYFGQFEIWGEFSATSFFRQDMSMFLHLWMGLLYQALDKDIILRFSKHDYEKAINKETMCKP